MRCPNYRLFCPNGLHLSHGEVCERCLGGREYWCILRNCENSLLKSTGYAARNAAARLTGRITDTVDRFIVLTSFQKRRFSAGGIPSDKMAVLPNIAPELPAPDSDDPGDQVGYVGRISPEKGIEDVLSAAARLPDIPFAVAGDHSAMPHLPPGSPKNVRWTGFLSGKALDDFYRRSRVLVFPGKWFEGFPNVIARAMAAGKPVIASDLGATPEIVEHNRCGLLFKPGDTAEMATRIRQLYGAPDTCRAMGAAGRLKAETQYSRRVVYNQLMGILTDARRR
jgi:glycosyltransferase involved in cell wall biosynthesis